MIFGLIFVAITLALDAWIFSSTFQILKRNELGREWRNRVWVFLVLGLGIAIYFAFIRRYEEAQLRTAGFPIPVLISKLVDGEWKDSSPPQAVQIASQIANFITGFAVALLPIKILAFFKQVKESVKREP